MPYLQRVVTRDELTGPMVTNDQVFVAWCIYERPRDFPNHYVLRRWFWDKPDVVCQLFDSIEQARRALPRGLVLFARHPDDDPTVVETWI